jgi:hypothetical protein
MSLYKSGLRENGYWYCVFLVDFFFQFAGGLRGVVYENGIWYLGLLLLVFFFSFCRKAATEYYIAFSAVKFSQR